MKAREIKKKREGERDFKLCSLFIIDEDKRKKERTRQKNMYIAFTIHITNITYITFALTRKMFLVD